MIRMRDCKGNERDIRVLVDHNGHRTLFQLVEVGSGADVLRLAHKLHAPAVVVDIGLPALTALEQCRGGPPIISEIETRSIECAYGDQRCFERRGCPDGSDTGTRLRNENLLLDWSGCPTRGSGLMGLA
jgi:hypothetical protein